MPTFTTAAGVIAVERWSYRLQGLNGADLDLAALGSDQSGLYVVDFARDGTVPEMFSAEQVAALKGTGATGSVAAAYMSIGEASDFRSFWNPAWTSNGHATGGVTARTPAWLGPVNPEWPESRKVRYWDEAWQQIIFNDAHTGWLDRIVGQGFDAAYLDIVDAYYYWAREVPAAARRAGDPATGDEAEAARRMIDFVVDMTAHARTTNPDFFVILQNGEFILDALNAADPADATRKAALLDAVGGIAVEDVYCPGGKPENNALRPDEARIGVLQRDFLANGIAVFAVDYISDPVARALFAREAAADGFIPLAAPSRDLDLAATPITPFLGGEGGDALAGTAGDDVMVGLAGDDALTARDGNNALFGDDGNDTLSSGAGQDLLWGGAGDDRMVAGAGRDVLRGEAGNDRLDGEAGDDTLIGGAGDDTYVVGSLYDRVTELAGQGSDTIKTALTITLGRNLENLVLVGAGPVAGTGNALDNVITGNAAANTLGGLGGNDRLEGREGDDLLRGGAGIDTLVGGAGNDRIYGDGGVDAYVFADGWGHDTIYGFNANAEKLDVSAVLGIAGIGDLSITQVAGGTLIAHGEDTILLAGVQIRLVSAADFIFKVADA